MSVGRPTFGRSTEDKFAPGIRACQCLTTVTFGYHDQFGRSTEVGRVLKGARAKAEVDTARPSSTRPGRACSSTGTPGCPPARSPSRPVCRCRRSTTTSGRRAAWSWPCSKPRTGAGWRARPRMYAQDAPLWRRYEQACDFLEDDLESGYVRVLQEMIAAGWSNPEIAGRGPQHHPGLVRAAHRGRHGSGRTVRRPRAVLAGRGGDPDRQRVPRFRSAAAARVRPPRAADPLQPAPRRRGHPGGGGASRAAPCRRRAEGGAMRAMEPDAEGFVERDGVKLHWETFGDGEPTIALLPDVVDHPVPPLEAPGALPGAPPPRRDASTVGAPAARTDPSAPRPTRTTSSRPTRGRCSTPRAPSRPCSSASPAARCGRSRWRPTAPSGCSAWW